MKNQENAARVVDLVGQRAANIFSARGYCCSETVIVVINQGFRGDLSPEMAVRLGSGFCHGMGGAGCTCGALAGAEVALSLFLGPRQPGGMKAKEFEKVAKEMHDRFRARFAATCCRVLLKRRKEKNGATCKELTVGGAEIAAELILAQRPELADKVDLDFLALRESKLGTMAKKLLGRE
ncbi:C-GCAxxG-C-C family protein [Thiovibrio frasassiensis]|uniref:C-GCAxxG-C-C family protein n=1 Tax=Thiovibrio frasassiensis TaxID=2984131 RepID=A0A9X4RP01_9BACT|nr:C-GCAxxG-C-C family protein [Thiovibrio frasassiensis]MDG4474727.1 C-GCAxxG-C-C family protein [Thiovibrio frasassiensis]